MPPSIHGCDLSSATATTESLPRAKSPLREFGARLRDNRSFLIGAGLFLAVLVLSVLADVIAPYNAFESNFRARLLPPSAEHWFGTDHFGRDVLSRALHGGRLSLGIGLTVVLFTGVFGTVIGAVAGYFRRLDNPVMRLMDALMAFPAILLALTVAATLGASVPNVIVALGIATTPHTARIVRASVLMVREMEYVEAARALGAGHARILFRHVLANSLAPLIVRLTFVFASVILAEAVLSYIGVGPPPPAPTLGGIIANGRDFMVEAPWVTVFPGLIILVVVLGLNLLGDGLRDVLDPRIKV